jgi:hypothetical protein
VRRLLLALSFGAGVLLALAVLAHMGVQAVEGSLP